MAELPYFVVMQTTLSGNASGTLSYTVARNEALRVIEMRIISTGAFNVTNIRDSTGLLYGNMSPSTALPSSVLQSGNSSNVGFSVLPVNLLVQGSVTLYIDVTDTSNTTNTVGFYLSCIRVTG